MAKPESLGLGISRFSDETWLQAAKRIAGVKGLEWEVVVAYERLRKSGVSDEESALFALIEWDVAELVYDEAT